MQQTCKVCGGDGSIIVRGPGENWSAECPGCRGANLPSSYAKEQAERESLVAEIQRLTDALKELHTLVWGECPSLLNEDSGGDAQLDLKIRSLLSSPCRMCGGSGFVAHKQCIDDGYGEVDSCPACNGRPLPETPHEKRKP